MFAHVVIDSYLHTAYAGINPTQQRISVTALPTSPIYGDNVEYTAAPDPAGGQFAVTHWQFRPDSATQPATTPCDSTNPCNDVIRSSGTMWAFGTLSGRPDSGSVRVAMGDPELIVDCPDTVTRGATVNCPIRVSRPVAFTLIRRQAGGSGWMVARQLNMARAANDTVPWSGTAVTTTDVSVQARLSYGAVITKRSRFVVNDRVWPVWRLNSRPDSVKRVRLGMRLYAQDTIVFATYLLRGFAPTTIRIERVTQGPDSGLAYVPTPPALSGSDIYYHPGLYPGAKWYGDQNGKGSGTCRKNHLDQLFQFLNRHEGQSQQDSSHYGTSNRVLTQQRPQDEIERMYTQARSNSALARQVQATFFDWRYGRHMDEQEAFDGRDPVPNFCDWDTNPRDQ